MANQSKNGVHINFTNLILYGNRVGFFDIENINRYISKYGIKKTIIFIKEKMHPNLKNKIDINKFKFIISINPKKSAKNFYAAMQKTNKRSVLKKLEDISDRSIMQDPL